MLRFMWHHKGRVFVFENKHLGKVHPFYVIDSPLPSIARYGRECYSDLEKVVKCPQAENSEFYNVLKS